MGNKKRKRNAQEPSVVLLPPTKQRKVAKIQKSLSTKATPTATPTLTPLETTPFVDNATGEALKREVYLYELLSSESEAERVNAANSVVSGLLGEGGVDEVTLQRHLERRLFRGLASGRKGARIGFSIVLAEILTQLFGDGALSTTRYTGLNFDKVVNILVARTKPDGDLSGQEEKDHHLGMLFGLQSFVRAKILFSEKQRWNTILEKLLALSMKKPWIREECGWVIMEAMPQMNQGQAEATLHKLLEFGLSLSPEGVGIWLTARNRFPKLITPNKPWGQSGNPLEHLTLLGKVLKESSGTSHRDNLDKSLKSNQTGNWNPKLHFVWDVILTQYITTKDEIVKSNFKNFWKVAVDDNLFSVNASIERKFWGLLLFRKVIQGYQEYLEFLPSIFSRNLMRCIINHVQDDDRFLNRAAERSLKILLQTVEAEPELLVVVLPQLISGDGAYNFDRITKTNTIERMLRLISDSNAKAVIEDLEEPVLNANGSNDDIIAEVENHRLLLGDYLLNIVRHVNPSHEHKELAWVKEVALPTLARFAYGDDTRCQPPLSEKTRILFRNRLMSAFSHLMIDLQAYVVTCGLLLACPFDGVDMDKGIADSKEQALTSMEKILKKIKKAGNEEKAPLQALALLYSLIIFQLYNGEPEAVSILDELKLCYDKLIRHKTAEISENEGSEVLVELLLSFISKPSALLRKATQHVFLAFMSDMTAGGLQLMSDILASHESIRGQQELFDQEPENEDDADMDEEEDDLGSDVEIIDMNGDEGIFDGPLSEDEDKSEDGDQSEANDEDDEDNDENSDEEAKKLDDALAQALGTHKLDPDAESESDSDADMTDSEIMALDSKLVEIFSQRKKIPNKKQEQKDAKETIINFKSRVLDLFNIYVKKQAGNPIVFGILLPLLHLIRTTKAKALAEKAHSIIASLAKAYKTAKKNEGADINIPEQYKLLKAIHLEASKDSSHSFAKAASTSSLLVASSIYSTDKSNVKKIATIYRDSQVAWIGGEVKMQAAFFVEWINWGQSHANST